MRIAYGRVGSIGITYWSTLAGRIFSKVEDRTTAVVGHMLKRSPVLALDPITYFHLNAGTLD